MIRYFVIFALFSTALGCQPGKSEFTLKMTIYPLTKIPLEFAIKSDAETVFTRISNDQENVVEKMSEILKPIIVKVLKTVSGASNTVSQDSIEVTEVTNILECKEIKEVSKAAEYTQPNDASPYNCLGDSNKKNVVGYCTNTDNCKPDENVYLPIPNENTKLEVIMEVETNGEWATLKEFQNFGDFENKLAEQLRKQFGQNQLNVKIRRDD